MAVSIYKSGGIFYLNGSIVPVNVYRCTLENINAIDVITIEDIRQKAVLLNRYAITDIQKESGAFYATKAEFVTACGSLFCNIVSNVTVTGVSTEAKQDVGNAYLSTVSNNLDVKISDLRDAAGRLRVSSPSSLGDYKVFNSFFDSILLEFVGTASFNQEINHVTMSVTAGQWGLITTKSYHPYLNGKSQSIIMTCMEFNGGVNVEKEIGYISSTAISPHATGLDGFRLFKDVDNVYSIEIWRNGSRIVYIPRSSWTDKLDGTGASGFNINWANFNVFEFDFLFLGGTALACYVMNGRIPTIFHIYDYANTDTQPIFNSPNKPLRWGIRSTVGSGAFSMVCGNVSSEGEIKGLGNSVIVKGSPAGIVAASIGVNYALCGVRKKTAFRDVYSVVDSFEGSVSTVNDQIEVGLYLNPTIGGTAPTWVSVTNSPLESFVGIANNLVTGGIQIAGTFSSQNISNNKNIENVLARLNSTIANVMDVIVLVATPTLGSTNVLTTGSMNVRWTT